MCWTNWTVECWTWWMQADDGLSVCFECTAWENMRLNVLGILWKDENDAPLLFHWSGTLCVSFTLRRFLKSKSYFSQMSPKSEGQQKTGVWKTLDSVANMSESVLAKQMHVENSKVTGPLGLRLSSGWTFIKLIELEMRSAGSHLGERWVWLSTHTRQQAKLRLILKTALTEQQF